MKSKFTNLFSGIALGALVGLLIGLSISQVVGLVLGALTSLLVAFFGLKEDAQGNTTSRVLISYFSVGCLVFVLVGIYLRNQNALSPSIDYYKTELTQLHLDTNSINKIILLKKFGVSIEEQNETSVKDDAKSDHNNSGSVKYDPKAQVNTSLFSSSGSPEEREVVVERFANEPYKNVSKYLKGQGPLFEQFLNSVELDVPDTMVRKRIFLQLIALTFKK